MGVESFTIVRSSVSVGGIDVKRDGDCLRVTSRVDSNGRGAKLTEELRLDAQWVPLSWRITGTSLIGAQVEEKFDTEDGRRTWQNQSDEGTVTSDGSALYVPADTSDLSAWIYTRAALRAGGTIPALPSGSVRATSLRQLHLGDGDDAREVQVYALRGATLVPPYVLLGADQNLIAATSGKPEHGDMVVHDDVLDHLSTLSSLATELSLQHLTEIQERVRHRYDAPFRVSNVRVFDPAAQRLSGPSSVTVFDGVITSVQDQQSVPPRPDELVIDGAGGTLLAGLHDMHAHLVGWSGLFCMAAGVTSARDMGNENDRLLDLERRFDSGELPGPTLARSGFIEGRSEYAADFGTVPETLDEALEAVRWYADRGYHQIKIYNSMNPEWVSTLAAEARRLGMRTVGHVPAFTTADRMMEAGYDEVTHINQLMLGWLLDDGEDTRTTLRVTALARARNLDLESPAVRHSIDLMHEHGVSLDTTLTIQERITLSRARTTSPSDVGIIEHMPIAYQRDSRRTYLPHSSEAELEPYPEAFVRALQLVRLLHEEGIALWPGTDEPIGLSLHRELELYVAAGIEPAQVLAIATQRCADHIGFGQSYGSIERGKAASFVLIDGDPIADISAIRRMRTVVKNGDVYYPSEIFAEVGIEPFVEPARVTTPG